MNRFSKKRTPSSISGLLLPLVGFLLILFVFYMGIQQVSIETESRELESLTQAIRRNIIHCYAVEGQYPPSLEYMEKHFGLTYNPDRYYIDYQPSGANLMPSVTIISLEGDGS